jgi:hypothetical protein
MNNFPRFTNFTKSSVRIFLALAAFVACSTTYSPFVFNARAEEPKNAYSLPQRYLLLVNTAIAFMMDESKFRQFDKSPYDGIAVAFLHAYDTAVPPSVASMDAKLKEWKRSTQKDIWPWVYANRIIAFSPTENNDHADIPYFKKIQGADLDDKTGALSDFFSLWRNSLAAARDSKVPGVVCDLEFYNNYKEYDPGELARLTGKTPAAAAQSLKNIGAQMARIAAEEYPDATLWFLVTGFTHPDYKTYAGVVYYPSPTYIAMGLLDEISQKQLRLRVITGGEGSLAYCHENLQQFQSAISKRRSDLNSTLQKYQGILQMAGTITLWSDRAAKKGWVNQEPCNTATAGNVEEFEPYLELLFNSYRYNWIYASVDGNYLPFAPESAPRFDAVIRQARSKSGTLH